MLVKIASMFIAIVVAIVIITIVVNVIDKVYASISCSDSSIEKKNILIIEPKA